MESVKNLLNFRNAAVFYDYKNVGNTCELSHVRKCIINSFYKTFPHSRSFACLSIVDDVILKFNTEDIEKNIEKIHELREKILYML